MRGASRASLADAKERLRAAAGRAGHPAGLGDDLFAVTVLLDREPPLRRALADSSSARSAREGLVSAVLEGRVSSDAGDLVTAVVTSHWSSPADLVNAIEQLAVLAVVTEAERDGKLDDLEDDLFRFSRVLSGQAELRAALGNPFAPPEAKRRLVADLLDGRATAQAAELVTQASLHSRGRSLDHSLAEYARLAAEQRERLVAEVRVATELSASQRSRLAATLARSYGHEVHLNIVLDPEVVGGLVVRIAGEQIDGSVATRLTEARRGLTA
jgi:F-type H+-transporting ATPase subunit delta